MLETESCKVSYIYAVTSITANNWFFGIKGESGIMGIGPSSPFLKSFIDITTNTMTYSIVVGRTN